MVMHVPKAVSEKRGKATGSIAHATEILICLSNDVHKISDIARQCAFSKSTVHRVLKLLEQSHLAVQDTINRRYYLGPLITQLTSNPITTHKRLITYAIDEMKHLSSFSEETVALDIMIGIQYLPLHEIPSKHDLKVTQESKKIGPLYAGLYAGASVKVLLAQLDENKLKILMDNINIAPETDRTVTDKELLMAQLREIRHKGYAISHGERVPGTMCIAAPISNYILPVGLSIVGPESRLQPRMKEVIAEIKAGASRISSNMPVIFGERRQVM
jgi:IclR family acetate operon transcriptional repressor